MENVIDLIANVGWPIVCCIFMWRLMMKQSDNHAAEMRELAKSVDNNTNALNELILYIKGGADDG